MINITLQFASYEEAIATLRNLAPGIPVEIKPAPVKVEAPKPAKAAKAVATPAVSETATPAPASEPVQPEPAVESPSEPVKSITLEEVRAKLAALSQAGKAPAVKALIAGAGFTKLTDIPADQYSAILEKAAAL